METNPHSHEREPQSKEVFLEIGPGLDPSALRGTDHYKDGRMYIGVDMGSDSAHHDEHGDYGTAA
jgi:hypothetical protein